MKNQNIILVTLDTTRADHLGCYGYSKPTSPNLDKLADESVLYTRAISPSSWTLPAHASLFTGKFTTSHGAKYDTEGPFCLADAIDAPQAWEKYRACGLSQQEITLADILKKQGYETLAVVGGPWMKKIFGLHKGFDYYDDFQIDTLVGRLAHQVTYTSAKLVERSEKNGFFLFMNYFDPHFPYQPPAEFAKPFLPETQQQADNMTQTEIKLALYDGEIRRMDHYFGMFLDFLRGNDLYDNSMIIVTADHGELFGDFADHGKYGHGKYLYQGEIAIPLFIKYPKSEIAPGKSDIRIQLTDILPLICDRLSIDAPQGIQGQAPPDINHPIISETYYHKNENNDGAWKAVFEGDYKFMWNQEGKHQLFNLENDPGENDNLIEKEENIAKQMFLNMEQYLDALPEPFPSLAEQKIDEKTKKTLQSLGYIE